MTFTRRAAGLLLLGAGAFMAARPLVARLLAHPSTGSGWPELVEGQDLAPNRPEATLVASDGRFSPERLEVRQDDLVKLTIQSKDVAHSFAIDEYRIVKRIPANGTITFEFRADRVGTFRFYCNLTGGGHGPMQGELVVRAS